MILPRSWVPAAHEPITRIERTLAMMKVAPPRPHVMTTQHVRRGVMARQGKKLATKLLARLGW